MSTNPGQPVEQLSFRRYSDGDAKWRSWRDQIFQASWTHKCPTYIQSTPPCQGSCPSGEDIRGYLNIVRGIEKPPAGMPWQEYAWRRLTEANLNNDVAMVQEVDGLIADIEAAWLQIDPERAR